MKEKSAAAGTPAPAPVSSSAPRWLVGCGLAGLLLAVLMLQVDLRPEAPRISVEGFDPLVATQITQAVAQVEANRSSGDAWGRLAMTLQVHELSAEAQNSFRWAARMDPRQPRWPYLHACLMREQDLATALALLREAANRMTAPVEIPLLRLAEALVEAGRPDDARIQFEMLLRAFPNQPSALVGLAELDRAQGQATRARERLAPALTNSTTARRAHGVLAAVEQQLGNADAATQAARRATTLPPDAPPSDPWLDELVPYRIGRKAWTERAQQLLTHGQHAEADVIVRQMLQHYPDAPETWLLRGRLHFERNDCAGAEMPLRRHLALLPESINGYSQLGMVLLCLERYADAVGPLQKCLELKPDFAEAHFNLGFALARSGRFQEAMRSFREAIRFSPNFVDPHITLADLLIQSGEKTEAASLVQRALQLNPADERAKELQTRIR
jgi:tetratricopeptide (TPR) repeat protein